MAIAMNGGAAAKFLAQRPPDYEEVKSALDAIVNDGQRVTQIIEDIGSLFRGDNSIQQKVDLNEIARDVIRILAADIRDNRIEVCTSFAAMLPPVTGHRGQLQEVVINLVINAIEAMTISSGHIRVLLIKTDQCLYDKVSMTIEDSGAGIPSEQLWHLFDAFSTSKGQGMGLGLAICKMIVERHGGQISATSNENAVGACFRFILPTES